jgi:hypothetical protein
MSVAEPAAVKEEEMEEKKENKKIAAGNSAVTFKFFDLIMGERSYTVKRQGVQGPSFDTITLDIANRHIMGTKL